MKQIIECKRVCMYDVLEEKVVAIFAEQYRPEVPDEAILRVVFNPQLMELVDLPLCEELWMKNSNIRLEVFYEYKEVEQWFDKIKRWFIK